MTRMASSGRYSKFPKVDRSVSPSGSGPARAVTPPTQPAEVVEQPTTGIEGLDEMTVDQVIEWVGDDEGRRAQAFEAESAGRQRKGVLKALSE